MPFNYKGYGTDKILTTAAATLINTLSTAEVKALQEKLVKLGLDTNGMDGIYGKSTTNAVMILQRRTGLVIDGIPGEKEPGIYGRLSMLNMDIIRKFARKVHNK